MPEEVQDVAPASSPADVTASSAEAPETEVSQQAPASPSPVEEQRVPYDRFQEVIREKQALQEQTQQLMGLLQQRQAPPVTPPAHDPWDGLVNHQDAGTAQFYQNLQRVVRAERQAAKQEAVAELQPVIQAGMERIAQMDIREFRKDNPEIKPGTEEERQVIAYMNGQVDGIRHPLESAKRNAMYDRLEQENRALKGKQQQVPRKQAANTESSPGIPQVSGLPRKASGWKDQVGEVLDRGGNFRDAANKLFNGG